MNEQQRRNRAELIMRGSGSLAPDLVRRRLPRCLGRFLHLGVVHRRRDGRHHGISPPIGDSVWSLERLAKLSWERSGRYFSRGCC